MTAQTPAEQALARSYTTGDGSVRFDTVALSVDRLPQGHTLLTYQLRVQRQGLPDERWAVTLPWEDKSFTDVFDSPAPDPERLRQLVHLVRALLEEWWDTKGYNRQSAKLGHRLL
ncbi:hypothetical protein [Streptomyces ambofaciens]|uniref:Uncharacterized protein n=1 Tax=Streptomyces ambofaciens TaxID=1889 RepID=Q0JW60_STRAM|nr:hypothetical protein [Streptomyces ambofaciens]CAK51308.1 hypothetical protein DSMR0227 [Streptomyces ambofaciens]